MKGGEQKSGTITIRRAANPDVDEITRLFYETVYLYIGIISIKG